MQILLRLMNVSCIAVKASYLSFIQSVV